MKYAQISLILTLMIFLTACDSTETVVFKVTNNTNLNWTDAKVEIPISDLAAKFEDFNPKAVQIYQGDKELAFQIDDQDSDGKPDRLIFVADLNPGESTTFKLITAYNVQIEQPFTKRTQAELSHKKGGTFEDKKYVGGAFENVTYVRVPDEHTDHSTYFRYEGPGWESDRVGYRYYLDWRNAIDIFGKKTTDMALQNVGQDGFDSYHEMAGWGMDVLKVGSTLGMGSIAMWHDDKVNMVSETDSITCRIAANGPVYSAITTEYYGWRVGENKYNLLSNLSIAAGDRKTRHDLAITGAAKNVCTGLVKHDKAVLLESANEGAWQYLATYGAQSLAGETDLLGMVIFYKKTNLLERVDDGQSHVIVLQPDQGSLTYYFAAAWQQEPNGITNLDQFTAYLEQELIKLENPVTIQL